MTDSKTPIEGVVTVRGAVVDVAFDSVELPRIEEALVVEWDQPELLTIEVRAHLDEHTVRGVALQAATG
jgi:F-type H+/Na+-transporting ATPase subunit beta